MHMSCLGCFLSLSGGFIANMAKPLQCICLTFIQLLYTHFTQTTRVLFCETLVSLRVGKNISLSIWFSMSHVSVLCKIWLRDLWGPEGWTTFVPCFQVTAIPIQMCLHLAILKTMYVPPLSIKDAPGPWMTEMYLGAAHWGSSWQVCPFCVASRWAAAEANMPWKE